MILPLHSQERKKIGSLAQLNRASDYGSEGYRFESYTSHEGENFMGVLAFLFLPFPSLGKIGGQRKIYVDKTSKSGTFVA